MSSQSRKARARQTETIVADDLSSRLQAPYAMSVGPGRGGMDVIHLPGLAPEVKAARECDVLAALRQAEKNANGNLPFVVERPDGYGPESLGQWPMHFQYKHGVNLLEVWLKHHGYIPGPS